MQKKHTVIFQKKPTRHGGQGREMQKASDQLDRLAGGSALVILDVKAVWPFNFFPDELIIDETKVSIHTNYFFFTKQVRAIEHKDIFNVVIQQGVFFAKLEIIDRFFSQEHIVIEFLKKNDAILARRIIQGMAIAKKQNVNTEALPVEKLLEKLERIGKSR